jgi:hypothetical protein
MKLFIHLKNTEKDAGAIKKALCKTDSFVDVEDDHVVVATSSIIPGNVDLLNTDNIWETWLRIAEFLDIINGAAKIKGVILNNVSLIKVHYEDAGGKQHILGTVGRMEAVLPGIRCGEPDISRIIPLALKDRAVAKAFRLFSHDLDWSTLCKIHEVMQEDVGGMSGGEFSALTGSANNSSVTGDFARHGYIKSNTPKKTLSLAKAQHLVKRTMREWIYEKLNNQ